MRNGVFLSVMLAVLSGIASAADPEPCGGPISTWMEGLYGSDKETAYRCLVERDDAGLALIAALDKTEDDDRGAPALSRALALYLLARADRPFVRQEIKSLLLVDRRLVRDGLRARKGRKSPAPNHHKVFEKFDWYKPDPAYTDGRLTELDRENSRILDKLPLASASEPARARSTAASPTPPEEEKQSKWFGCASVSQVNSKLIPWFVVLVGLIARCRFADLCRRW
jgi:hypothetical protein